MLGLIMIDANRIKLLNADQFCQDWDCKQKTQELGQAIVDAKLGMVWAK